MTTAILAGGIVAVILVGWHMRRPEWRLPALLFALLAIPGNIDNLMPQMRLDAHDIENATAPAISFVDLLITWAVVLTAREGRFSGWPGPLRALFALAVMTWAVATAATIVNMAEGMEALAGVRGILIIARIPAMLALAWALRDELRDGRPLAFASAIGIIALIGNGLYTSTALDTTRFTGSTFGRNGFSLVLVIGALLAAGLAIELRRRPGTPLGHGAPAIAFLLAAIGLFGAIATGTRMSLLAGVPAIAVALIVNRSWWNQRGIIGVAMLVMGAVVVSGAAMLWTTEGARALSALTDPGNTVEIITDSESEPDYSPVRTRTRWWGYALTLLQTDPVTGIGAYQWNIERYRFEPDAVPVTADPHNTYIQLAAEFGLPTVVAYVALLAAVAIVSMVFAWRSTSPVRRSAVAASVLAAGLLVPVTEVTNSYLFNVRIGATSWLLLGAAVALTLVPALAGRASSMVEPSTRGSRRADGARTMEGM